MEFGFHNEGLKKLIERQNELKRTFKRTAIILIASSILFMLILILIGLSFHFELYLFIIFGFIFVLFFDLIFMVIFCGRRKRDFYCNEVHKYIVLILQEESDFDINITHGDKYYISQIRKLRFQDGDFCNLNGAFDFNDGDFNGTLYNLILSRSNGKTSYVTLNGVIVSFNLDTTLDAQIRNDLFAPMKLKKVKEISNKDNRIYLPRKENGKYDKLILDIFEYLKNKYDVKSLGIDFCKGRGSFYLNFMNKMIKLNNLNKEKIIDLCRLYIDCLNTAREIKNKIEGEFING